MIAFKKSSLVWFIVVGVVVILVGAGGFVYQLMQGFSGLEQELIRIQTPTTRLIDLKSAGVYTVFREVPDSPYARNIDSSPPPSGLKIDLTGPGGEIIPVRPVEDNSTYNLGGHRGFSIMEFQLINPGRYKISATVGDGQQGQTIILTLAHNFVGRLFRLILTSGGILLGALVIGVGVIITGVVLSQEKKPPLPVSTVRKSR